MAKSKEHVMKTQFCLKCGYTVDRASSVGKSESPKPGNVTVCFRCAHIMLFGPDLTMRDPTPEELADILKDPEATSIIEAIKEASSRHPPKPDPRPM